MSDPKDFLEKRGFLTIHMLQTYLERYHPLLSVTYPTLRRYVDRGIFKPITVGGQYRIPKDQIDRFTEQGTDPDKKVDTTSPLLPGGGSSDPSLPRIIKQPMPPQRPLDGDEGLDDEVDPEPPATLIVPPVPKRQPVRPNVPLPPEDDEYES